MCDGQELRRIDCTVTMNVSGLLENWTLWSTQALICSFWWFPWCKYFHCGQFQATYGLTISWQKSWFFKIYFFNVVLMSWNERALAHHWLNSMPHNQTFSSLKFCSFYHFFFKSHLLFVFWLWCKSDCKSHSQSLCNWWRWAQKFLVHWMAWDRNMSQIGTGGGVKLT